MYRRLALVATIALLSLGTASAQLTGEQSTCRARVGAATLSYGRSLATLQQACFRAQMLGELPFHPPLECSDPELWASTGYAKGSEQLETAATAMATTLAGYCGSLVPHAIGFLDCPPPCDGMSAPLSSFTEVAVCLRCLTDHCQESLAQSVYGNVPLADQRSDSATLGCQDAVGRASTSYLYKRMKLQLRCQRNVDNRQAGWAGVDCTDLDSATHPQHGKILKLQAKLSKVIERYCADAEALGATLDSCGSDHAAELTCVQQAALNCLDVLHVAALPGSGPPTPTPLDSPSPTPTPTPIIAGRACSTQDDCSSAMICSLDSVCCNDACAGVCESCLQAETGATDGACHPVRLGHDPQAECDDNNPCTIDACDGQGACTHTPASAGSSCGDATSDECSAADTCDGQGTCLANHRGTDVPCGAAGSECAPQDTCDGAGHCQDHGFVTAGSNCGSPETECSGQDTCDGAGQCLPNDSTPGSSCGDPGSACIQADVCDGSGHCMDGGFANQGTLCGAAGSECSAQDTCDGAGQCLPNHHSTTIACGPAPSNCTEGGHCDGSGRCTIAHFPEGSPCGEATTECSAQDTCDGQGTCRPRHLPQGSACGDRGDACTNADACDGNGSCLDNGYRAPGSNCGAPASECSAHDTCDGTGNCMRNDLVAGTACGSGVGNDCTAPDTCDGAGSCRANHAPVGSSCGDPGSECTQQDQCDGDGSCIDKGFALVGSACGSAEDTDCTDPDRCDGQGTCERNDAFTGAPCGDTGNECVLADSCDGFGACRDAGFRPRGTACGSQTDSQCDDPDSCDGSGICTSNPAAAGAPCGDTGSACVVQDTCSGTGTCNDNGYRASGTACGDPTASACTAPDTCNAVGQCRSNNLAVGTACGDSASECRLQDTCDGSGACRDNGFVAASTPCGSADANPCDRPDSCDGAGACRTNPERAGTRCGDAGVACVSQDVCNGNGACLDVGIAATGTPCADDDNPCTDDVCAADGTCQHIPNRMPCQDGLFCNGADSCIDGGCTLHAGNPCPGADGDTNCAETCNEAGKACSLPDPDGSSCDDGLFCNGTELCSAGTCVSQNVDPCPQGGGYGGDDDDNCGESCDELTNTCTAPDPDGIPCNDNQFCTGADAGNLCAQDSDCSSGNCGDYCSGPDAGTACTTSADCPNGGTCSVRACAPRQYTVDGSPFVIEQDRCQAGQCIGGAPPCPGDQRDALGRGPGLSVTCQDSCDEGSQTCTAATADHIDCRDGNFCNGASDSCQAGTCQRSGDPCAASIGDDDDDCSESCTDTTACLGYGCFGVGTCTAPDPEASHCVDGNFCTAGDSCRSGTCTAGSDSPCDGAGDDDDDCSETCVDTGFEIGHCNGLDPNGSSCTDKDYCNGSDSCLAGACADHSGDPCGSFVGDGDNNCAEACIDPDGLSGNDEGSCSGPDPAGATCQDGLYCTTTDTCNGSGACVGTGSPCANQPRDCRHECNESTDSCDAQGFINSACDDGRFCTLNDYCSIVGFSAETFSFVMGCISSGDPCDAVELTPSNQCQHACNESTRNCDLPSPDGGTCIDDGRGCNGTERCYQGQCKPEGVCCATREFLFEVESSTGDAGDIAKWKGGQPTQYGSPDYSTNIGPNSTCAVTVNLPSGDISKVGSLGDPFAVHSWQGYGHCRGHRGEDGDGCRVKDCGPVSSGFCQATRPSCTSARDGKAHAEYIVLCEDP